MNKIEGGSLQMLIGGFLLQIIALITTIYYP